MGESAFYALPGPLDVLPAERQMRAGNFGGFVELVRHLGGDPFRILERHGLDASAIANADYCIDCSSMSEVFEYCSSRLDDSLFGLRLARFQDPEIFGCATVLCRNAPTVAEALRCFMEYIPLIHSPMTVIRLVEGDEVAELRYGALQTIGGSQQANYEAALVLLKLLHQLGGPFFQPKYMSLTVSPRRSDIDELEKVFGCPLYVNTDTSSLNIIAFRRSMLDQPVPNASNHLYRLLGGYLERLKATSRANMIERVKDYICGALPTGNCSIERCAHRLGVSSRTLQAYLSEQGTQFSDILEQQRTRLARVYLEQDGLSLDEVAFRLGYAEQSSFGRAFKRWTGMTPRAFRSAT